MKKFVVVLILLMSINCVFGQESNYVVEIDVHNVNSSWIEAQIDQYYRWLESGSLDKAYNWIKRDVDFKTYKKWYSDIAYIITNKSAGSSGVVSTEQKQQIINKLDRFEDDPEYNPNIYVSDIDVILGYRKGKVFEEFYYKVSFFYFDYGPGGVSIISTSSKSLENNPIEYDLYTIKKYYKFLEYPKRFLKDAWSMKTTNVDFETYKDWYNYDYAETNIYEYTEKDGFYVFKICMDEYTANKEVENFDYKVKMKVKDGKIVSSSVKAFTAEQLECVNNFFDCINNGKFNLATEFLSKNSEAEISDLDYIKGFLVNVFDIDPEFFCNDLSYRKQNQIQYSDLRYDRHNHAVLLKASKLNTEQKDIAFRFYSDLIYKMGVVKHFHAVGGKPVIYLYPEQPTDYTVKVSAAGGIQVSDPPMNDAWKVKAQPDGTIYNYADKKNYPYLFWEAYQPKINIPNAGFMVKNAKLGEFFDEKLAILGLNSKEIADFKEFWVDEMGSSPWFRITFISQSELDRVFPIEITPAVDKSIRVYFIFEAIRGPYKLYTQQLEPVTREAENLMVEWGGRLTGFAGE